MDIPCGKLLGSATGPVFRSLSASTLTITFFLSLDWLLDRRVVSRQWHKLLPVIQEKVVSLMGDLPQTQEIKEIVDPAASSSSGKLDYHACDEVVQYLLRTEGGLTLFRQYSSQRLKDWIQVKTALEKDGLYLAETGYALQKLVLYDMFGISPRQFCWKWSPQLSPPPLQPCKPEASTTATSPNG